MRGQTRRLVAGAALLLIGLLWLLRSLDLLGGGIIAGLGGAAVLFLLGAVAWLGYQGEPARRPGLLVPAWVLPGLGLIALGGTFDVLPDAAVPLILFASIAAGFVHVNRADPRRAWALLVAWIALVIGLTSSLEELGSFGGEIGGAIFLWGSAAPFLWYFLRTGREWALVPGGILASFGLVPLLESVSVPESVQVPAIFFALAATFGVYSVLGAPGRTGWARVLAFVLGVLGVIAMFVGLARVLLVWGIPVALIAIGIHQVLRATRSPDATPGGPSGGADPPAPPEGGAAPAAQ